METHKYLWNEGMGTRHTRALASTIADLCPHARRNHTHLHGPEGTWLIGGEAEEQTGQSHHLWSKVGARLFIPFGIKQLCSRLRRVAQRRPPTCPRPHREAQQSQTQLQGATAVSPEALGMPTWEKQLEQERKEGREGWGCEGLVPQTTAQDVPRTRG